MVLATGVHVAVVAGQFQYDLMERSPGGSLRVPGSRFRRIPRESLYRFMKDNGIPTDALDSGKRKILVVDDEDSLV